MMERQAFTAGLVDIAPFPVCSCIEVPVLEADTLSVMPDRAWRRRNLFPLPDTADCKKYGSHSL